MRQTSFESYKFLMLLSKSFLSSSLRHIFPSSSNENYRQNAWGKCIIRRCLHGEVTSSLAMTECEKYTRKHNGNGSEWEDEALAYINNSYKIRRYFSAAKVGI